jgi:hypothetical protein
MSPGDRVWFAEEARPYTAQAVSGGGRYVALTKPFAARRTVLYTVVDTVRGLRGVDDSLGNSLGYETPQECQDAVDRFASGRSEYSQRCRPIPALVVRYQRCSA